MSTILSPKETDLIITDKLYEKKVISSFQLMNNVNLRRIVVGGNCFSGFRSFELKGLRKLESIVIGVCSFQYNNLSGGERSDSCFRIVNCPKLKSLWIGDQSFSDYHSFELVNLHSLQSIEIGEYCFIPASLSLTSLVGRLDSIYRSSSIAKSDTGLFSVSLLPSSGI